MTSEKVIKFLFPFALLRNMTDLMIKEGVVAFVGPDESCLYEALVASAWNLPMISYVSLMRGWQFTQ